MMKLVHLIILFFLSFSILDAQTTAWLRVGGPDSRKVILAASNSSPVVIVSQDHGFKEGDVVWVSFVNGNTSANGVRRIRDVSANSFSLIDLQGKNVDGNGDAVDFNPVMFPGIKGYVGRVQESKILESPGLLLDGPSGSLTMQVHDPDGVGGAKAPKANLGWAPYAGMQKRLSSYINNPEKAIETEAVRTGAIPHLAALDWYMDNSRKQSLIAAKYWINNVDKFLSHSTFTACEEYYKHCGSSSYADWMSFSSAHLVYAYSLIRSEMSPAERQLFADKMLNDQSDINGCQNTLSYSTGTVSINVNSEKVIGTDTKFLTDYANIVPGNGTIKFSTSAAYPAWAIVKSVESDTELTLTKALSKTNSYQGIAHGAVNQWKNGSCGVKWYVSHHGSSPNIVTKRLPASLTSALTASSGKISVDSPANFPSKVPFYVKMYGSSSEIVEVVAVDKKDFTVKRGAYGTAAKAAPVGTKVMLLTHPSSGGTDFLGSNRSFVPLDAPGHNLVFAKVYGYITMGMGLANDDPRAVELLQDSWNYYYDFQYPLSKAMWTGITQGGFTYGPNRWMDFTFRIAVSAKNSFSPSIDITDGDWLKNLLVYPIYVSLPYQPTKSIRFADSGSDDNILARYMKHILMGNWLLHDSYESKAANFWYRSIAEFYNESRWSDADSHNSLPYALIFSNPVDPVIDIAKNVNPYYFFTKTDTDPSWNDNSKYNAVVSRQNWSPAATYLWVSAFSRPTDHLGSYTGPGSYKILKNQYLIGENGPGTQGSGSPSASNYVQVGESTNLRSYNYDGGQIVKVDRQFGSDEYVYFRVDSLQSYKKEAKLEYIYRHFVHLKSDSQDYVFVYDDINTKVPMDKLSRVHYYSDDGEIPEFSYEGDLITFKRKTAMISTRVILPIDVKTPESLSTRKPTAKETIQIVAFNGGKTTTGEFLVVHKPTLDKNDKMPESQVFDVGTSFRGVLVHEAIPKIVIFPRGNLSSTAVNFSIPGSSINHDIVVTGLSPGFYSLAVNGQVLSSNHRVASDGSLFFKSPAGTVSINRVGITDLEIGSERPPIAWMGTPFFFRFKTIGGEQPYHWTLKENNLPAGINLSSDGELSGIPQELGTFSPIFYVGDATGASTEIQVQIEVYGNNEPTPLSISNSDLPSISLIGNNFFFQMVALGGVTPYHWKLMAGVLPIGLSMDENGSISGVPVIPGRFPISVQVFDSSTPFQSTSSEFVLEINSEVERPDLQNIDIIELPDGNVGSEYFLSLPQVSNATFQSGWLMNHGEIPNGMYMDTRGQLSGVPVKGGVFTFSVRIMRQAGPIERFYIIKIH